MLALALLVLQAFLGFILQNLCLANRRLVPASIFG
jgi:hypothetical protein